jgi:hypothetical protein
MDSVRATRVLVVASRTAATPWLLNEIERRSKAGPCEFALLVPLANRRNPDWTLDVALAQVEQAAGRRVQTVECDRDYVGAVRRALSQRRYDEVIVSTRPPPGPKWLNPAPMRWLDELGVPVTVVALGQRAQGSLRLSTRLPRRNAASEWAQYPVSRHPAFDGSLLVSCSRRSGRLWAVIEDLA